MLIGRPKPTVLVRSPEPMSGGVTARPEPGRTCRCRDPELDRLVDLINVGMDQVAASRLLWGGR